MTDGAGDKGELCYNDMKFKPMKSPRILILLSILPVLAGCAKLTHLPQLLTLKAYSDNKDLQHEDVLEHDTNFKKLLEAVADDSLSQYPDKKSILKEFDEPILKQRLVRNNTVVDRWLYRYATQYFDSEKVYIYFNKQGKLLDFKHVVPKTKEPQPGGTKDGQETASE